MPNYDVNLKNGDYFTVEVEEDQPAPKLSFVAEEYRFTVENLPDGWSVQANEVLYIEPSDD